VGVIAVLLEELSDVSFFDLEEVPLRDEYPNVREVLLEREQNLHPTPCPYAAAPTFSHYKRPL
jgi:hypothetical protein